MFLCTIDGEFHYTYHVVVNVQSARSGRRLGWAMWGGGGGGRCMVGGCVDLLSDNLHQIGVA